MKSPNLFFAPISDEVSNLSTRKFQFGERLSSSIFPLASVLVMDEPGYKAVIRTVKISLQSMIDNERTPKPTLPVMLKTSRLFLSDMLQHSNILLSSLDLRESQTGEHSRRVARLAVALGEKLGLNAEDLALLRCGSLLHDIGKVGVPDDVLLKVTELTNEDWEEIRAHPLKGANLLKLSPTLQPLAESVLRHHERFDGGGYPGGLKGKQIPYLSRIVSVVDAYEVMTSNRVYKTACSESEAKIRLLERRGTQFDPDVVDAFIEMKLE